MALQMDQSQLGGLSLRFEPPDVAPPSLQQQIQQLVQERKALRHITEAELRAEIGQSKSVQAASENGQDEIEDDDGELETPQVRKERLWKVRDEMIQKLAYAQNEVLSALDFVSLLLSRTSAVAQNSMSPALKQLIPTGTIEGRVVEKQDISASANQDLVQVSDGWKADSFRSASEKLSEAAGRLEKEAQRQNRYWNQVASLKAGGWAISRLPTDSRAIGVHYGFQEAAPQFRSRSFALVQQDDSSNLKLDTRSLPDNPSTTKVTIVRNGIETGSSHTQLSHEYGKGSVSQQIQEARDAIFEEELFHEISREARLIANQGTRTRPRVVEATIDVRTQLRITQTTSNETKSKDSTRPDDQLAEAIALNMRLLLMFEHSKSKQRRSRPPAVMSLVPKTQPEYALLRPVLAHQRHQASLSALHNVCQSLSKTCSSAGLEFTFEVLAGQRSDNAEDMQRLRQPVRSTLEVRVQSGRPIKLDIETYLGSPIYGTIFRSSNLDFGFIRFPADAFNTPKEAVDYITHAMVLEIISLTPEFEVLRPHSGEISLKSRDQITAVVTVRPQSISLLVASPERVDYNWRPSGYQRVPIATKSVLKSFKEVVESLKTKG